MDNINLNILNVIELKAFLDYKGEKITNKMIRKDLLTLIEKYKDDEELKQFYHGKIISTISVDFGRQKAINIVKHFLNPKMVIKIDGQDYLIVDLKNKYFHCAKVILITDDGKIVCEAKKNKLHRFTYDPMPFEEDGDIKMRFSLYNATTNKFDNMKNILCDP